MGAKLHWIKEAFSRKISILDQDHEIGVMWQDSMFSHDVHAKLRNVHVLFDVKGFLKRSVNIHDLNNSNKIIGVVNFSFGRKAELLLPNGKTYLWRRQNFFMREWSLIQVSENESSEVLHYELLHSFFVDKGEVSGKLANEQAELLILTGLFIGNYFRRRRRRAAAAS